MWGSNLLRRRTADPVLQRQAVEAVEATVEEEIQHKREFEEYQAASDKILEWPSNIFECVMIVGLEPTADLAEIAIELNKAQKAGGRQAAQEVRYNPEMLYMYPESYPLEEGMVSILKGCCFPKGVPPRLLRRTSSMSGLQDVLSSQGIHSVEDQFYIFIFRGLDALPLYCVCCVVLEMLHRPPALAQHRYPSCTAPLSKFMVAAPRCYCLLSKYPFFDLHTQILRYLVDAEQAVRQSQLDKELLMAPPSMRPPLATIPSASLHDILPESPLKSLPSSTPPSASPLNPALQGPASSPGPDLPEGPATPRRHNPLLISTSFIAGHVICPSCTDDICNGVDEAAQGEREGGAEAPSLLGAMHSLVRRWRRSRGGSLDAEAGDMAGNAAVDASAGPRCEVCNAVIRPEQPPQDGSISPSPFMTPPATRSLPSSADAIAPPPPHPMSAPPNVHPNGVAEESSARGGAAGHPSQAPQGQGHKRLQRVQGRKLSYSPLDALQPSSSGGAMPPPLPPNVSVTEGQGGAPRKSLQRCNAAKRDAAGTAPAAGGDDDQGDDLFVGAESSLEELPSSTLITGVNPPSHLRRLSAPGVLEASVSGWGNEQATSDPSSTMTYQERWRSAVSSLMSSAPRSAAALAPAPSTRSGGAAENPYVRNFMDILSNVRPSHPATPPVTPEETPASSAASRRSALSAKAAALFPALYRDAPAAASPPCPESGVHVTGAPLDSTPVPAASSTPTTSPPPSTQPSTLFTATPASPLVTPSPLQEDPTTASPSQHPPSFSALFQQAAVALSRARTPHATTPDTSPRHEDDASPCLADDPSAGPQTPSPPSPAPPQLPTQSPAPEPTSPTQPLPRPSSSIQLHPATPTTLQPGMRVLSLSPALRIASLTNNRLSGPPHAPSPPRARPTPQSAARHTRDLAPLPARTHPLSATPPSTPPREQPPKHPHTRPPPSGEEGPQVADLRKLRQLSPPGPGELITFHPSCSVPGYQPSQIEYLRPDIGMDFLQRATLRYSLQYADVELAESLQGTTIGLLCRHMSLPNIITLLSAALLEQRLVVLSPRSGLLTVCTLALIPLLRPFRWPHHIMTVLPSFMGNLVGGIGPMILGVHCSDPLELQQPPYADGVLLTADEVVAAQQHWVMLNLTTDKYTFGPNAAPLQRLHLPGRSTLAAKLSRPYDLLRSPPQPQTTDTPPSGAPRRTYSLAHPDRQQAAREIATTVQEHLEGIMQGVYACSIKKANTETRVVLKEQLVSTFSAPKEADWMAAFTRTQLFDAHADELLRNLPS